MPTTLRQTEAAPASYPVLSPPVLDQVWQRVEAYIAWRYSSRTVTWIVEGCGEWFAPLAPATITTLERWNGTAWETWTPVLSPRGYELAGDTYRFTATVGAGATVPAAVATACQRLSTYMATAAGEAGARSVQESDGRLSRTVERSESWMAGALANCGAADLLRPYRRIT